MAHDFRRLKSDSDFPHIGNVDVYKYDNDFDYSRYDYTQMELQICSVPWDMGEAHIGNRTISGIGNVVYFGSKSARDAWFDAIPDNECYRFSTKFKELHRDLVIDVPIPYDVCARFNYLKVHYSLFANDDSPVMLEDESGLRDWFWFIREVEFIAPNTTRLHLLDDAFQTWIYDVDITGMILERGHAPMFEMTAERYLQNPIENCTNLLTDDVSFGQICQVKHMDVLELNSGDMYACIATTANPTLNWGLKSADTWNTPASASYTVNGNPSVYVFAVSVSDLAGFLARITATYPQFKQTVKGVFFASADLITLASSFTFAETTCYLVSSNRKTLDFVQLNKTQFGYPTRYADIAKLYTSPYAHIEITDENGNVDVVRIEDTDGTLDVSAAMSLAYPYITIDAHIMGAGGYTSATVTYKNITSHSYNVSGQWYETLRTWNVPTFAVVLDAASEYDYSTHFDRAQRVVDYTTAYDDTTANATTDKTNRLASALTTRDNAYDSADTAKSNAYASAESAKTNVATIAQANKSNTDDSADTAKSNVDIISNANNTNAYATAATSKGNVDRSALANKQNTYKNASTTIDNADLVEAANTATVNRSNQSAETSRDQTVILNTTLETADNLMTDANATSTISAADQQGMVNIASGMASSVVGIAGSGLSGDFGGAATSVVNGLIGAGTTLASTMVGNGLTASLAANTKAANSIHTGAANTKTRADTKNQTDTASDMKGYQNTLVDGTAANNADALERNADRTYTAETTNASDSKLTSEDNADRTYTAETTAAAATRTTTKANATRTQTAENTAAALTETTTKANALATQTTGKGNALRSYNTDVANVNRDYDTVIANAGRDRSMAQSDIANDVKQAALRSPFVYGEFANGESSSTKPMALFANVVTQSKAAIASAGDEMLRYGYMLDRYWEFNGNWNIGRYFTYWKLRDFWISNLNVPDMYMDKLRFFLFGGVTVWRNPSDIGKRTIYDNFS